MYALLAYLDTFCSESRRQELQLIKLIIYSALKVVKEGHGLESLAMFAVCLRIPYSGISDSVSSGIFHTGHSSNFIDKHLP